MTKRTSARRPLREGNRALQGRRAPARRKDEDLDIEAVRARFPALQTRIRDKRLVYLDSACTALKSAAVAERLNEFYLRWGGCGGQRSTHLMSQQVDEWFQETRGLVASFINAERASEIVFTSGTTEAVNLVARAFPYEAGRREVVLTELEHNSVILPFLEAARRGEAVVRWCPAPGGRLDEAALAGLISERTALVAVTHASNVVGGTVPVERVARMAHRRGAMILVDDAQYLSSHREDVQAVDADFAAFSSHKLGGPFGVGALYGKQNLLNRLRSYKVGGGTVRDVAWSGKRAEASYLDAPQRFEAGVQNFGGVVAFGSALRLLSSWPSQALRRHMASLVRQAFSGLARFQEIEVLGDAKSLAEGSIVSFQPKHPKFSMRDFGLFLNNELPGLFIAVRIGEHCAHLLHHRLGTAGSVRLSFFAYNESGEVDLFLEALEAYLREIR